MSDLAFTENGKFSFWVTRGDEALGSLEKFRACPDWLLSATPEDGAYDAETLRAIATKLDELNTQSQTAKE